MGGVAAAGDEPAEQGDVRGAKRAAGIRASREHEDEGRDIAWYASGRRGVSSLTFRGKNVQGAYVGFTDRPAYADARHIADDVMSAYADEKVDRVEIVYNHYISPLQQRVTRETPSTSVVFHPVSSQIEHATASS